MKRRMRGRVGLLISFYQEGMAFKRDFCFPKVLENQGFSIKISSFEKLG